MTSVEQVLGASLSPDAGARTEAERQLTTIPAIELVNFAKSSQSSSRDIALRQAALVYLKNYVLRTWSVQFAEYAGQPCPEESKHALRHGLFDLIGDGDRAVRLQAAYIVSRIVSADYPEEWTTVLDDLLGELARPQSPDRLEGALVVMKDFVDDSMSEEQFVPVAQTLVGHLLVIARDDRHLGDTRALAVDVFMSCLDTLEMLSATRREGIRVFVDRALPPWLETVTAAIAQPDTHPALRSKAISTILKLRLLFPSQLVPYLPALFEPVYRSLAQTDAEDDADPRYTGLQVEFVRKALQARIVVEETLAARPTFEGVVALALKYARVTLATEEEWRAEIDGFVEDLEETALSTRHVCSDILEDLQKINGDWFAEIMASTAKTTFASGDMRGQEAFVFVCTSLGLELEASASIIAAAASSTDSFLRGRGAIYAAQLGLVDQLDTVCTLARDRDTIVRLCAIKALARYASDSPERLKERQLDVLATLGAGTPEYPPSALLLVSETLGPIIDLDPAVVLRSESPLPTLFALLARNPGDITLTSTIVDIFEGLAGSVDFTALCNAVLPILFDTITHQAELRPVAMEILNGIVQGGDRASLPDGFVSTLWPMFHLELDVEEQQTAHEILRNLVAKAWPQVVNGGHVDDLLRVVGSALASPDESASAYVAPLLVTFLRRAGGELISQILPRLLEVIVAIFDRQPPPSPHFQSGLVQVFACVAAQQARPLVDFLAELNGGAALQKVMTCWCDGATDFTGYSAIRTSCVGLSAILATEHPALESVIVRGDLIPDTSGRILTRSRARQTPDKFTQLAVPVKILKLLLNELANEQEGNREDDDEEELVSDDEWEQTDLQRVIDDARLDEEALDREEEDDDDQDPLAQINTRDFVVGFIRERLPALQAADVVQHLTERERETLSSLGWSKAQ